jgi:hypothetical protein
LPAELLHASHFTSLPLTHFCFICFANRFEQGAADYQVALKDQQRAIAFHYTSRAVPRMLRFQVDVDCRLRFRICFVE